MGLYSVKVLVVAVGILWVTIVVVKGAYQRIEIHRVNNITIIHVVHH